jgi:hypothetical protein
MELFQKDLHFSGKYSIIRKMFLFRSVFYDANTVEDESEADGLDASGMDGSYALVLLFHRGDPCPGRADRISFSRFLQPALPQMQKAFDRSIGAGSNLYGARLYRI